VPVTVPPALRVLRALVLAVVAVTVGAAGHVSADGLMPGPVGLLAVLATTTLLAGWLLARPASTARVLALLMAGQTLVHLQLTMLAGHGAGHGAGSATATPAGAPVGTDAWRDRLAASDRSGSLRDQLVGRTPAADPAGSLDRAAAGGPDPTVLSDALAAPAHVLGHLLAQDPRMLLVHTLAAVVAGLWLAAGEQALFGLLALLLAPALLALRALTGLRDGHGWLADGDLLRTAHRCRRDHRGVARHEPVVRRPLLRRGPPVLRTA
jgi:hypothetical protein